MLIGYARVSTVEQVAGLEAQERDLRAAGCEEIFAEKVSSIAAERPRLKEALRFVRKGDTLICTKPDRLARSIKNLVDVMEDLAKRQVVLRILSMGDSDPASPTGKLMLTLLGAIAEFERELMLSRQREGIAKAKAEGKYIGRPTNIDIAEIRRRYAAGETPTEVAKSLGVARSSVYRLLKNNPPQSRKLRQSLAKVSSQKREKPRAL
jgi:DNA invertase Pin-like site-specific DNA recombinase